MIWKICKDFFQPILSIWYFSLQPLPGLKLHQQILIFLARCAVISGILLAVYNIFLLILLATLLI